MRLRERPDSDHRPATGNDTSEPDSAALERLQREGRNLLDAAEEAIARALSGDSRKFLEATRQQGGE